MLLAMFALLVHVEVDMMVPLDSATIAKVATEVIAIWKPYADVAFEDGPGVAAARTDAITLRVVDRLRVNASTDEVGLGWIDFRGTEPATTITVSVQAAHRLADAATLAGSRVADLPDRIRNEFVTHALSRSIAHEIGHYLLRSPAHANRGLMRARFSSDEFLEHRLTRYRLQPSEIEALRGSWASLGRPATTQPSSQPAGVSTRNTSRSYHDDCLEPSASTP